MEYWGGTGGVGLVPEVRAVGYFLVGGNFVCDLGFFLGGKESGVWLVVVLFRYSVGLWGVCWMGVRG